jgi:AcrR family transcriptional regulator
MAKLRGSYQATEATRNAILVSAFNVFSKSGFRGGSLKQVADLVGLSEAGVLHHFKSKRALLIAVLEYRDVGTEFNLLPTEMLNGEDFIARRIALVDYNVVNKGIVELYCILSAEATAPDHPAHEYFKNRYAYVRDLNTRQFEILKNEGKLRDGLEPDELSKILIAITDGLQVQWLLDPNFDMVESTRAFFRGVLNPEFKHLVASHPATEPQLLERA